MINIMNILGNTNFLLGVLFLGYFFWLDLKKSEITNAQILPFLAISLIWAWISPSRWILLVSMPLLFGFGLLLWYRGIVGGADVKILPLIIPFLALNGIGEAVWGLMRFVMIFGVIGTVYGLSANMIMKRKEVPFLPAILLSYVVFWMPKLG